MEQVDPRNDINYHPSNKHKLPSDDEDEGLRKDIINCFLVVKQVLT